MTSSSNAISPLLTELDSISFKSRDNCPTCTVFTFSRGSYVKPYQCRIFRSSFFRKEIETSSYDLEVVNLSFRKSKGFVTMKLPMWTKNSMTWSEDGWFGRSKGQRQLSKHLLSWSLQDEEENNKRINKDRHMKNTDEKLKNLIREVLSEQETIGCNIAAKLICWSAYKNTIALSCDLLKVFQIYISLKIISFKGKKVGI